MIRTISLQHGIHFPTRNIVNEKAKYHPVIKRQTMKSSVEMDSLLKSTFERLVETINFIPKSSDALKVIGRFGLDTSGGHKLRHQLVDHDLVATETPHLDPNKTSPFLIICYCPYEMKYNEEVIWKNPVPNSTAFSRPVSLGRAKEERSVLEAEISE